MKPEYRAVEVKNGNGHIHYNLQQKMYFLYISRWVTITYVNGRPRIFEDIPDVKSYIRECEYDRLRAVVVSRTTIEL